MISEFNFRHVNKIRSYKCKGCKVILDLGIVIAFFPRQDGWELTATCKCGYDYTGIVKMMSAFGSSGNSRVDDLIKKLR